MFTSGFRSAVLVLLVVIAFSPAPVDSATAPARPESPAPVAAEPRDQSPAVITVVGDTPELEAEGWEAIRRLAEAGFDLPAVDLQVYGTTEPCRAPDGTGRVGVTIIYPDRYEVLSCGTMATLMHELAHVWEHHVLDDATRQALLDLRGLDSWSHETWSQAGGEHLAAVVSWGMAGTRQPMISPADDTSMAIAYELVTGTSAPILAERGLVLEDGRLRRRAAN